MDIPTKWTTTTYSVRTLLVRKLEALDPTKARLTPAHRRRACRCIEVNAVARCGLVRGIGWDGSTFLETPNSVGSWPQPEEWKDRSLFLSRRNIKPTDNDAINLQYLLDSVRLDIRTRQDHCGGTVITLRCRPRDDYRLIARSYQTNQNPSLLVQAFVAEEGLLSRGPGPCQSFGGNRGPRFNNGVVIDTITVAV
jgi:hypothetical protein